MCYLSVYVRESGWMWLVVKKYFKWSARTVKYDISTVYWTLGFCLIIQFTNAFALAQPLLFVEFCLKFLVLVSSQFDFYVLLPVIVPRCTSCSL